MRSTLNGSIVPARFLVDTNILAHAFDARDSAKQIRAEMVLAALIASDRGSISVQILGEFTL
jgi:predicted nucleic acid-binding protein